MRGMTTPSLTAARAAAPIICRLADRGMRTEDIVEHLLEVTGLRFVKPEDVELVLNEESAALLGWKADQDEGDE
jgi:hypothetical protein